MTSPSAFLYRYTPGSVGMVRIFWSRSTGEFLILDEPGRQPGSCVCVTIYAYESHVDNSSHGRAVGMVEGVVASNGNPRRTFNPGEIGIGKSRRRKPSFFRSSGRV